MYRLFLFLGLFGLSASDGCRASADDAVGDAFTKDFASTARQSTQSGIPVVCTITPRKGEAVEVLADRRVVEQLKRFLPLSLPPTSKLAKTLTSDALTVAAVLDAHGAVLARCGPTDKAEDFIKQLDELAKKARAEFQSKLAAERATAAECKTAAAGLIRMGGTAAELMPLLRHRSMDVKAAVAKALSTLPEDDVGLAALDGLASEDVEMRAVSYKWAAIAAPYSKAPALKFWREADESRRKAALEEWRTAALTNMGPLNKSILEFCESNLGKQVGGGECSHLATEAFKVVSASPMRHSGKTYIWGREVTKGQKVLPGDIVQLEDCKFANASAPHHTQVVRRVLGPNRYEILEQNANGRRTVGPAILDLNKLLEGSVKIYRPVPK